VDSKYRLRCLSQGIQKFPGKIGFVSNPHGQKLFQARTGRRYLKGAVSISFVLEKARGAFP